jgi:hypothetical protein
MFQANLNRSLQRVHSRNSHNLNPGMSTRDSHRGSTSLRPNSRSCLLLAIRCFPTSLILSINASRKAIERSYNSLSRSTRWPLGLLDETRQRLNEEKEEKVKRTKEEAEELGRELRYTQQVVAGELAGWQDLHEKMGRKAIRDLARSMLIRERTTLEGMRRAMRKLRVVPVMNPMPPLMTVEPEVVGEAEVLVEPEPEVEGEVSGVDERNGESPSS